MNIESSLNQFSTVSLDEIKSVNLMNRMDIKFVFSISKLYPLLINLIDSYNILEIDKKRIQEYKSLYYDTIDRFFFLQHHNGRGHRNKVRFREYVNSGLSFLEVKSKNNKKKTIKRRMNVEEITYSLSKEHQDYINQIIGTKLNLIPQQWVNFNRITFVDKLKTERLTIDLDLNFSNEVSAGDFKEIVVAEIKQDRFTKSSQFVRFAKMQNISPIRLSKYCMSTINLEPGIKKNRFKEKVLLINKLKKMS